MDIYDKKKRSKIMSCIRGYNTKPEMVVRQVLHSRGYRFRLHRNDLPGKPDVVLPRYKAAIFVHGCFWHHHKGCSKSKLPETNIEFWQDKIFQNVKRDRKNIELLKRLGWKVLVVWECETRRDQLGEKLAEFLHPNRVFQNELESASHILTDASVRRR